MDSRSQQTSQRRGASSGTAPIATSQMYGQSIHPWLVLLSLSFGLFISLLDTTIVNIALTNIQMQLHTDLLSVGWVVAAYNLTFAILLVTVGRLADQYGRKSLFLIGMVLFSLGSLFCGLAPSIEWLIGFRVLQAVGGAALNPVSLAIINAVFPLERRGTAMGIWGALIGLSAACGPVLGGLLVQTFNWHAIFFVNLPFCILGLIMVTCYVPETSDPGQSKRVDVMGMLLLTSAFFCLVLALIKGLIITHNSG